MKPLAEWFWTDRWDGSSAALLPLEARGLYREMLTQAWRRGARLPSNVEAIKRAVRCTDEEWARCWPLVKPYWVERDGWLTNETQVEVWEETRKQMEARSSRGAAAARKRWQCSSNARALPEHMLGQSLGNALRSPDLDLSPDQSQDQKIPSESPSPSVTPPVKRKTDPLILDLKNRLGSGVRICGDQVRALRGAGWDDARIAQAISEFAEPGMAPWEWTKKARGVVPASGSSFKTASDRADETLRILAGGGA